MVTVVLATPLATEGTAVLEETRVSFTIFGSGFYFCLNRVLLILKSILTLVSNLGGFGSFGNDTFGGNYANYGGNYAQVDWWGN